MSNTSHGGSVVAASRWTLIEKDKKKKLGIVCENWWDFTVYRSNQIKKKKSNKFKKIYKPNER